MRKTRRQTDQYGNFVFFGKFERVFGQIVAFLLGGRLDAGNHGELRVEAGVLFVLGGMHGRIVRDGDEQTTICACHGGIYKTVSSDVQADVLHADDGAFSGVGDTEGLFHGRFFIGRPFAMDVAFRRKFGVLNVLHDFRGRGSRIGIAAGEAGVQDALRICFVTKQDLFHFADQNFTLRRLQPPPDGFRRQN